MTVMNFPPEIHKKLKHYVYLLIDPRNNKPFYIGKGQKDRVFSHINGAIKTTGDEDETSLKMRTIREILKEGLSPNHIIHRHGLEKNEAFLVEAALIDATPGLTNEVGGHGSNDKGPATADDLISRYKAETMQIDPSHRVMAINIRKSVSEGKDIYNAVRFAWRIDLNRANKIDFVFAVINGICRGVFVPEKPWLPATAVNFPDLTSHDLDGRFGFIGEQASSEILQMYCGKRLPANMQRKKGMASPILYSQKKQPQVKGR